MRRAELRLAAGSAALAVAVTILGCATLAPGEDAYTVRAEQVLSGADAIYADAMAYYFIPGKAASLPPKVVAVFEKVRTGYDRPYKALQTALDTYKAAKAVAGAPDAASQQTALLLAENDLATLVNQVLGFFPPSKSNGKPLSAGGQ